MKLPFAFAALVLASSSLLASNSGTDNASNYGGSWTDGSNGGTGFGPWNLSNNNNNGTNTFAGYFLGDSTGGTGNLNTGGSSFGMYANPGNGFADATRAFAGGSLEIGQTFTLSVGVNFRNGNKGFDMLSNATGVFNFNVGADQYVLNGQTLALAYQPDSVFTISLTPQSATSLLVIATRTSAAGGTESVFNGSVAVTSADSLTGFKMYISGTDGGGAQQNNLYFNSLSISAVPEPSTYALALVGLGLLAARRRQL